MLKVIGKLQSRPVHIPGKYQDFVKIGGLIYDVCFQILRQLRKFVTISLLQVGHPSPIQKYYVIYFIQNHGYLQVFLLFARFSRIFMKLTLAFSPLFCYHEGRCFEIRECSGAAANENQTMQGGAADGKM